MNMNIMKWLPRVVLTISYVFLLIVLLPHTAWMFSILEPNLTRELSIFAAIAFEITIGILTYYFSVEISKHKDVDSMVLRLKKQFSNVPAMLLILILFISIVANWTHGYIFFAENLDNTMFGTVSDRAKDFFSSYAVRLIYSILFGAILPICSFAYAHIISIVSFEEYGHRDESDGITDVQRAMLVILDLLESGDAQSIEFISPELLSEKAMVDVSIALQALSSAVSIASPKLIDSKATK